MPKRDYLPEYAENIEMRQLRENGDMNICIYSTYTCTFDDFMAQVEKSRPE